MRQVLLVCGAAVLLAASAGQVAAQDGGAAAATASQAAAPDGGDAYRKQSITGGFLYEFKASTDPQYLNHNNGAGWSASYGIRPKRWLMLEAGIEQVPRPYGTQTYYDFLNETVDAKDQLYLIPFGARFVWEEKASGMRVSVGGGGAYMKYTVGSNEAFDQAESAWGTQAVAAADFPLTHSRRLRVGVSVRWYSLSHTGNRYNLLTAGPILSYSF